MAKQLLGKEVTAALNEKIKANVAELQGKGVNPTLCIIRVGENPSDISYERGATKRCETLGVACEKILLPEDVSQEELLATIDKVNKDDTIHGVLLFRPLPNNASQLNIFTVSRLIGRLRYLSPISPRDINRFSFVRTLSMNNPPYCRELEISL